MSKLKSKFSTAFFTFFAFSSVISNHVFAKDQVATQSSVVQRSSNLSNEKLIALFAENDFELVGGEDDKLAFSVLGRPILIDKSNPQLVRFVDASIKLRKGFSAEKLNKWLTKDNSSRGITPATAILDNRLVIMHTQVSLEEPSLKDVIASAIAFAAYANVVEEAKSQFEK